MNNFLIDRIVRNSEIQYEIRIISLFKRLLNTNEIINFDS